jgi:hypothetical protein
MFGFQNKAIIAVEGVLLMEWNIVPMINSGLN